MALIDANPGIVQGRAADALRIKRPHFAALLGRLEARALVRRVPHDGRTNRLFLTAKGARVLARANARHDAHDARVVHAVGEDGRAPLLASLRRIADALADAGATRSREL